MIIRCELKCITLRLFISDALTRFVIVIRVGIARVITLQWLEDSENVGAVGASTPGLVHKLPGSFPYSSGTTAETNFLRVVSVQQ